MITNTTFHLHSFHLYVTSRLSSCNVLQEYTTSTRKKLQNTSKSFTRRYSLMWTAIMVECIFRLSVIVMQLVRKYFLFIFFDLHEAKFFNKIIGWKVCSFNIETWKICEIAFWKLKLEVIQALKAFSQSSTCNHQKLTSFGLTAPHFHVAYWFSHLHKVSLFMWNLWNMKLNFLNAIRGRNSIAQSPCLTSTYFIFRLCFCAFWTYNCILEKQICATLCSWSFYFNFFCGLNRMKNFSYWFCCESGDYERIGTMETFYDSSFMFPFRNFHCQPRKLFFIDRNSP